MKTMTVINTAREKIEVDVHSEHGPLIVTTAVDDSMAFTVTHKVLGVKIRTFSTLEMAKAAAEQWRGLDWEFSLKDKAIISHVRSIMMATKYWSEGS